MSNELTTRRENLLIRIAKSAAVSKSPDAAWLLKEGYIEASTDPSFKLTAKGEQVIQDLIDESDAFAQLPGVMKSPRKADND